ncbi:fibronectin-binding protein A N-terminus-domain-containing protein [Xylariaceae sp. AK1471]|nr:fibronectin-binding protein A N-terminus-domain-containing protein [Xylariaceae sp. AK1471]
MKQRFSSLDVKVIAHELSASLVSLRLSNVYDLSSKILLFKFAKPDNKKQLLVDSGFRCHLTEFARTTAAAPSIFVQKLRKALKTRRLTAVSQIGTDRIIEFQFSDGLYRIYLEFFAGGNVILTDNELKILTLLRHVPEGEGQEPQRPGLTYSLENRQNYGGVPPLTKERLRGALHTIIEKNAVSTTSAKKIKKKPGDELRKGLAVTINELPPILLDHAMKVTGFDSTVQPATVRDNEASLDHLLRSLQEARNLVEDITSSDTCKGYILAKTRPGAEEPPDESTQDEKQLRKALLYEDFHPFLPRQYEVDPAYTILTFDTFGKTVDEFFSSIEGQKLESRLTEREAAAKRKLEAAKAEQDKRIEGLQAVQTLNVRKANAIEANIERVQEAMDAVNGLIHQGMDWVNIGSLIDRERRRNNPVAAIISLPLKLQENTITVLLGEAEEDEEEDEAYETDSDDGSDSGIGQSIASNQRGQNKRLSVDINLGISPHSNAREYYGERKTAAVKEEKTKKQSEMALKSAEQKIAGELRKGLKQEKPVLQPIRRQMWFEKFIWFLSTDGYLVLGGKDAQQNEMLYRRYLKKGDTYVHADLHGAASVVIKNNPSTPDAPIPPSTLAQAGSLAVCSSSAWDSKASMSAWWVLADQVSKSAPTGEFLPTGSFMVRGMKNFLPASQLVMGFALMFKVSEESKAKHVKHRLYDTPVRSESLSEAPAHSTSSTPADTTASQENEIDAGSDSDESAAEEEDFKARVNPLQSFGGNGGEGERLDPIDEAESSEQMNQLAITKKLPTTSSSEPDQGLEQDEQAVEDEDIVTETDIIPTRNTNKNSSSTGEQSTQPKQKGQQGKRGQRAKAKKIAAKYKDQDEEDRAAIEALIGASAAKQRAEAEAKAKAEREAAIEATRERRRAQHQRQQREMAEHEEVRKLMLDEGVEILDPDEVANLSPLDALVGTPLPGDEILEVVALCAPYAALGRCKYKVKLQPGAQKKGKAVKEILEAWKAASTKKGVIDEQSMDKERMWPREVELIKAIKPEDVINAVPIKSLKVMASGVSSGSGGGGGQGKGKGGGKGGKKR